jgi:hypothetical protein
MPTYGANILPDVTGRDLGSAGQKWDLYSQNIQVDNLTVLGAAIFGSGMSTVAWSATPIFDFTNTVGQSITLTGNVTSSTVTGATSGRLYCFQIAQDGVGNWSFVWPANFKGATSVDKTPSTTTHQLFWYDGTNFVGFASAITT